MVNPKNIKQELLEIILNQGYDINDIMEMTWAQVDALIKEGKDES